MNNKIQMEYNQKNQMEDDQKKVRRPKQLKMEDDLNNSKWNTTRKNQNERQ